MNFLIDREEARSVTKIGRTKTFEMQKHNHWLVVSTHGQKNWFCLEQVLQNHRLRHRLSELHDDELHRYQRDILLARLYGRNKSD